jgi:hypothetical protein
VHHEEEMLAEEMLGGDARVSWLWGSEDGGRADVRADLPGRVNMGLILEGRGGGCGSRVNWLFLFRRLSADYKWGP